MPTESLQSEVSEASTQAALTPTVARLHHPNSPRFEHLAERGFHELILSTVLAKVLRRTAAPPLRASAAALQSCTHCFQAATGFSSEDVFSLFPQRVSDTRTLLAGPDKAQVVMDAEGAQRREVRRLPPCVCFSQQMQQHWQVARVGMR